MRKKGYKTIADPDWLANPDNIKEMKMYIEYGSVYGREDGLCPTRDSHQNMQAFFPEDYDKDIPNDGCWILATKPPFTEIKIQKFSIWFAVNAEPSMTHPKYPIHRKLASIITPDGELRLWPWEYNKIELKKYLDFLNVRPENSEPDMNICFITEDPKLSKKMGEMVFYMQSRGISRGTAYMMLIEEIKDQNFCYFEMHDAYVQMFTR